MGSMTLIIIVASAVFSIVIIVVVFKYASNMMGDSKVLDAGIPGQGMVMSLEPTGHRHQRHVLRLQHRSAGRSSRPRPPTT